MSLRHDLYSRSEMTPTVDGDGLHELPSFCLTFLFSERKYEGRPPRQVTILPETNIEENYTKWITADYETTVDLSEVA